MSLLGDILGVEVGDVLQTGVSAALSVYSENAALQIAQMNLQAQQSVAAAATAATSANNAQLRLIITGGLVLGAAVLAMRALRR